jgi:hypothetical protein
MVICPQLVAAVVQGARGVQALEDRALRLISSSERPNETLHPNEIGAHQSSFQESRSSELVGEH